MWDPHTELKNTIHLVKNAKMLCPVSAACVATRPLFHNLLKTDDTPTGRVDKWGSKALHIDLLSRTRTVEITITIQHDYFLPSGQQPHWLLMKYPNGTSLCTSLS